MTRRSQNKAAHPTPLRAGHCRTFPHDSTIHSHPRAASRELLVALTFARKSMKDKTDRPGVVILPPVLMALSLLVALTLHRFWPLPIGMRPAAVTLGIVLSALGIGSAAW